jgi:hypothetical protein
MTRIIADRDRRVSAEVMLGGRVRSLLAECNLKDRWLLRAGGLGRSRSQPMIQHAALRN